MNVLGLVVWLVILTFSYIIIQKILAKLCSIWKVSILRDHLVMCVWGVAVILISLLYPNPIVFHFPTNLQPAMVLIIVVAVINLFVARYSGYHPVGQTNIIHFVIAFPIIEEILFRGLLLPILSKSWNYDTSFEIFGLSVTLPILISSLLFSLSHLQYYSFSRATFTYMLFAWIGGIVFGLIAYHTHSILFTILLHIEFNFLAFFYATKRIQRATSN